jgi:hypothetical protein
VLTAPSLLTTEVVAHAAEAHILRERRTPEPVRWEEPPLPDSAAEGAETPAEVLALLADLGGIAKRGAAETLGSVVPREDSSTSFLRASLLALVGHGLTGEGIAGQLGSMALMVETDNGGWPEELEDAGVHGLTAVTPGRVMSAGSKLHG